MIEKNETSNESYKNSWSDGNVEMVSIRLALQVI